MFEENTEGYASCAAMKLASCAMLSETRPERRSKSPGSRLGAGPPISTSQPISQGLANSRLLLFNSSTD